MAIQSNFNEELVDLEIEHIIFSKKITYSVTIGRKYKQILSSIKQIGIIECPVVTYSNVQNSYVLLDGHLRLLALKELGKTHVTCLVSKDDESYTYNKYINKISPIQETKMILRAVDKNVSKTKLSQTLGINIETLEGKLDLVKGISEEAVDLLKDKQVNTKVFRYLKKMKPERQLEVAKLMNDLNNYTIKFAKSLFDGTPDHQLAVARKQARISSELAAKQASFEAENLALSKDISVIKGTYQEDMLNMVSMQSYLKTLLANEQVSSYLAKYHAEYFDQFTKIATLEFLAPAPE